MQQEKSPEDEAFDAITQSQMKKATGASQLPSKATGADEGDDLTIAYMCGRSDARNAVLEEVAKEFDKMKVFGTTAESFAAFVRAMKR